MSFEKPMWTDHGQHSHPMAKHHAGAYRKGWRAREEGIPITKCPYNPRGQATVGRGRVMATGERAYARAWIKGWEDRKET